MSMPGSHTCFAGGMADEKQIERKGWAFGLSGGSGVVGGAEGSALHVLAGWQRKTSADKRLEMVFCAQVLQDRPVALAALTWCSQCKLCMHTERCPLMYSALGSRQMQSAQLMLAQGKQNGCGGTGRSTGKQPRALQPKPGEPTLQTQVLALLSVAAEGARVAPGLAALCRASPRCPFRSCSHCQQLPFD